MTPKEELALREQIQAAQRTGNAAAELELRNLLAGESTTGFDVGEMVSNIPSSATRLAQDMLRTFTQPVETARAVGGLVEAGLERINPFAGPEDYQYQQYPEAVAGAMRERYGGIEEALRTLQEDPVGMLADVSGAVTGAGMAARLPAVKKAGTALDPVNLALNVPAAGVAAMTPRALPTAMYEKAAKFPPAQVPREVRQPAIETALREKIMPTYGGIDKITDKLGNLDAEINSLINAADESGKRIHRYRLYDELFDLQRQLKTGADAPKNIRDYKKVVDNLEEMLAKGPDELTPSQVQKFKTETYKQIKWRGKPTAKTETLKALARGARKAIEDVTPEIAEINRRYGPLAELRDVLQQPAQRIYNRNPLSLLTTTATPAGYFIGGWPGAVAGAAVGMAQNPAIMSRMALSLRGLQDRGMAGLLTAGSPMAQMLRQGALQSGRLEELMEEED